LPKYYSARHAVLLGIVVLATAAVLAGSWAWYLLARPRAAAERTLEGLQVFGTLPEFSLTERDRRQVTRADLLGKVWVANFIYTTCTDTCPLQSARMAALQRDLSGDRDVRFLSITVDPRRDTPAVLAKYAARYEADRERWWFLTGDKRAIYALIQEGFRLSVEDPTESAAPLSAPTPPQSRAERAIQRIAVPHAEILDRALGRVLGPRPAQAHSDSEFLAPPFLHGSWFVLGDRQARIRGYYRTENESSMTQLRRDIRTLLSTE
jgi:cytochrome oxidase Cu insertion factor (SCO1/SenC/PrrC family)